MFKDLIMKNRSVRGFDPNTAVPEADLLEMIDCARLSASSRNVQPLKYMIVIDDEHVQKLHKEVHFGRKLPELNLPFKGTEPPAYILICQDLEINDSDTMFLKDVGIVDAAITLAAAEMGYGACIIGNFVPKKVSEVMNLPERYAVRQVIAIGKSVENIVLVEAKDGESTNYFRDETGTHYVPKRKLEDILIR